MKRRNFITLAGAAAGSLAFSRAARTQQSRVPLIGMLMGWEESDPATQSLVATFRGAPAKRGWTEGSNLRFELRWGDGNATRIKAFAKELVSLRPDVILGQPTPVIRALTRETQTIPIGASIRSNRQTTTAPVHTKDEIEGAIASQAANPDSASS